MLISLTAYAAKHGKSAATARQMALRGGFKTAQKIGRDWLIDDQEPYPDRRIKSGKYKCMIDNEVDSGTMRGVISQFED